MTDDAVVKRILKFMRQMNSEEDQADLLAGAVSLNWLDSDGAPTLLGRELVESFEDIERATEHYLV